MELKVNLRERRLAKGLTIRDVAEKCDGLTESVIQRAEQGKPIRPGSALALAKYHGFEKTTDVWSFEDETEPAAA